MIIGGLEISKLWCCLYERFCTPGGVRPGAEMLRLYEIQGTDSSPLSLGTEAGLSFIEMD